MTDDDRPGSPRWRVAVMAAVLLVAAVELVRTAWISDDAAITLRTVLNLVHGYGARFNVAERVQAYTHPLWFLAISAITVVVRDPFWATYLLSIAVSLLALGVLLSRLASGMREGALAGAALLLSQAYVDHTASGLENPLSHLLLLLGIADGLRALRRPAGGVPVRFLMVCALGYLSRPDLPLLIAPFALYVMARTHDRWTRTGRAVALAAIPVVVWTLGALFYYGFPLPNPAYAKLGTGIPRAELAAQGLLYLRESLTRDPLTLTVILAASVIGLVARAGHRKALAIGVCLYVGYVVSVGGDFMSGRFLTPPLVVAVALIATTTWSARPLAAMAIVIGGLGLVNVRSTVLSGAGYTYRGLHWGIADERGFYMNRGLLRYLNPDSGFRREASAALQRWEPVPTSVNVACQIGFRSIFRDESVHLIDLCALADPLLARLPAAVSDRWRIGHFLRWMPTDYIVSVEQDANLVADLRTREYYSVLRRITRGGLLERRRLADILAMNLGRVPAPDWSLYRFGTVPRRSGEPSRQRP